MNPASRLFTALYILITVYLTLSFVYGKTGLISTEEMIKYRQTLYSNILELKKINNDLSRKLQPLSTMENIRLRAREMGYISANERKIFLEGMEKPDVYHSLGNIIYRQDSAKENSQFIRSMSLIFSLLFYIFSSIVLSGRNGTRKNI
jgi:cell division protein FtsB